MISEKFNLMTGKIIDLFMQFLPKVILAIIVLIIGWWLIKRLAKLSYNSFIKKELDPTIATFSGSALSITLKIVLIILVASIVGFKTGSLVALLGAGGLAVGLALQGTLGNLAGGVIILTFKPFQVGDFIESGNFSGEVKAIQFFSTTLLTQDNKIVTIPNSALSNGITVNYSKMGDLRATVQISVKDTVSPDKVIEIALNAAKSDSRILSDLGIKCQMTGFGNSSLNFSLYFFTKSGEKNEIESDTRKAILKEFNIQKIQISEASK